MRKHLVEQLLLVAEVIVHQRVVDADLLRDVLQRDAVQAMLGKESFRGVENLLHHLGALRRLGDTPGPGPGLLRFAGSLF
jgi:hypothetical protein